MRFIDNQARIGIEAVEIRGRMGEEFFVDGVLALDRKYRNTVKTKFLIKCNGLVIVMAMFVSGSSRPSHTRKRMLAASPPSPARICN